jgi:mannose-6-phosphate isomerase-like protein (cupin superfamily)
LFIGGIVMEQVILKRFEVPDETITFEMRAGDLFYIPPGHDSWVLGDENYVSLHFLGAEKYAAE